MVVSNSESFLRRWGLEIDVSGLILDASLSWASSYPGYPLYSSHWFGVTHSRGTCLSFHPTMPQFARKKMVLNQGSSSQDRRFLLCIKFLFSYILQFPLPLVIANESIQSWIPKESYYCPLFSKEEGKWCLSHFTSSYRKPAKFEKEHFSYTNWDSYTNFSWHEKGFILHVDELLEILSDFAGSLQFSHVPLYLHQSDS